MTMEHENAPDAGHQPEQDAATLFDQITDSAAVTDQADEVHTSTDEPRDTDTPNDHDADGQASHDDNADSGAQDDEPTVSWDMHQKLTNDYKAAVGRLKAMQRTSEQKLDLSRLENGEDLSTLAEDYGDDLVKPLQNYVQRQLTAQAEQLQSHFDQQLAPMRDMAMAQQQSIVQQQRNQELSRLSTAHPDWQDVNSSTEFRSWLGAQSGEVQALYRSEHADANIALLNQFKADRGYQRQKQSRARPRRLADHAELPRKGAGKASAMPTDPAELFDLIT